MPLSLNELIETAIRSGLMAEPAAEDVRRDVLRNRRDPLRALTLHARIPTSSIYRAIAITRGVSYVGGEHYAIDRELLARVPASLVRKRMVLPIREEDRDVLVATGDPDGLDDTRLRETLRNAFGKPIRLALSDPDELGPFLTRALGEPLTEASAVEDFYNPPKIVVGERTPGSRAGDVLLKLYESIEAPVARTEVKVSEMVKYADNCFNAIKVCFANEIGNLCKALGVPDSHKVMEIFCLDTQLNLSPYYLKPGFAFGGSCLPKDLRAVVRMSGETGISCPVLSAAMPSNQLQIERAIEFIRQTGKKKVGVLGMSFKAETDDLRESPIVQVVSTLIGKGYELSIYDRNISWTELFGSNLGFLEHELPYAETLKAESVDDLIERAEVIVVANPAQEFRSVGERMREDQVMVDLVRIVDDPSAVRGEYIGISW